MAIWRCKTHGVLDPGEKVCWSQGMIGGSWCVHCINKMMDELCGKLILVEEKEE